MSRKIYSRVFPRRRTLLIVIHVENQEQASRNAAIAFANDADGIFLIHHRMLDEELLGIYAKVRRQYPKKWIGLNLLSAADIEDALLRIPRDADGLWCDDAGICDGNISVDLKMFNITRTEHRKDWKGLFFGGVAHKGGNSLATKSPAEDARIAADTGVTVITTSGPGTNKAPTVEKLRQMRDAAGDHPITISSGMSHENILEFMPYVDCFLVNSSVSDSFTELNAQKVRLLANRVHTS